MIVSRGGGGLPINVNGVDVTKALSAGGGAPVPFFPDVTSPADRIAGQPLGTFPQFKPPIISTGVAALFDESGNLWVARERVHGDPVPHFDVIAEGKGVIARVNLPSGTRLVGFGKNSVYLARAEDGSDWLERYEMPKM
jgi:hypothetical protein